METAITPDFIRKSMAQLGLDVTNIATATGIDQASISGWVDGSEEMSQPVKAMFYFYFQSLHALAAQAEPQAKPDPALWNLDTPFPNGRRIFVLKKDGSIYNAVSFNTASATYFVTTDLKQPLFPESLLLDELVAWQFDPSSDKRYPFPASDTNGE